MKRFLIAAVVGVFVFTLAAPLFAAEITVRGYSRVRYRYEENRQMDQTQEAADNKRNYIDQRVRIAVDAKLDEGLSGRLETDYSQDFGTNNPFGTSAGPVGVRQAWAQAKVPGTPVTIRVGRDTSLSVGHEFVVGSTTYGIDQVRANLPMGPADIWLFYAVAARGTNQRFTYDETDVYGVTIPVKAGPGVVINPYAFRHHAGRGTGSNAGELNEYIVGAAIDVKQGPMSAWIEAAYNGGKARDGGLIEGAGRDDITRRANFVAAGADFTMGNTKFSLELGRCSGDKDGYSTTAGTGDKTATNFNPPISNHPISNFLQDTVAAPAPDASMGQDATRRELAINGPCTTDNSSQAAGAGIVDAAAFSPSQTYVRGGVEVKPNPEWTFGGELVYSQATSLPGTAKRGIGTEINGIAAWRMYRNFTVTSKIAYFFAGPFFTRYGAVRDGDPDNPFLWRIYGELNF